MTRPSAIEVFDRQLLRMRRDRAAMGIGDYDFLLRDVAARLVDRLSLVKRDFPRVLDLGAHHGLLADMLKNRNGTSDVFASDMSPRFAEQSNVPSVAADEEFLPFQADCMDAVISNLSLQWVNDLPGALLQIRHTLKPDGLFLSAVLGGESLRELRESLMQAELTVTGGASPRVSPFIDMRDMGGLMQRAGFALPVVDSDMITVDYPHALKLMQDLRGMGASNATRNRLMIPTRREVLLEAGKIYQEKFGNVTGRVPATFQIIYAIGWKPHASQQQPLKPGSATVRLADALKAEEVKTDDKATP
ncbi:MAG TPA: methyltransferase domain-containing protein [Alphaproteobacteria bacterium]|jgi:SAM-dependent methyltransferase|nr:methyltransferase domain-containing protein [Alphaproteobacteria bacterium]